ncbi:MAG: hypothetical protein KBF49_10685, partial [Flavobacteriales bacterium]|nr:hypothetical protein [Flavobacteriales bacterium]
RKGRNVLDLVPSGPQKAPSFGSFFRLTRRDEKFIPHEVKRRCGKDRPDRKKAPLLGLSSFQDQTQTRSSRF